MNNFEKIKEIDISNSLNNFSQNDLLSNTLNLFKNLGYATKRTFPVVSVDDFKKRFLSEGFNKEKLLFSQWSDAQFLFELQPQDLSSEENEITGGIKDGKDIEAYWFIAIELKGENYTKKQLSEITREINKQRTMPVFVLFKYADKLTFSIIDRRLNKKDSDKDVLEKVVLIKDINYLKPHIAHIEILNDISFEKIQAKYKVTDFIDLHKNWLKALSISELNKKFYSELSNWFFWMVDTCQLSKENTEKDNVMFGIRLVTRIIFNWFIKEKGILQDSIFDKETYLNILKPEYKEKGDLYYKVILQNLFFGCLSKPMDRRGFRSDNIYQGKNTGYNVNNLFRYAKYLNNPQEIVDMFKSIPFLNGGLFECLDEKREGRYLDCFTDNDSKNFLKISDDIFFLNDEKLVDISKHFDGNSKFKKAKVKGLFKILNSYKFTIDETTPVEEEIALDPELLGRVFENLLAAYNPETKQTARKSTGSYYTPREIVDYMCEQSLFQYLKTQVESLNIENIDEKLQELLSYSETQSFNDNEVNELIKAVNNVKILDPACGSGAFPMGLLHKLVHVLSKLDPHNTKWKESQIKKAEEIDDYEAREEAIKIIEKQFDDNEMDYSRKLYLIQNCIFGVDIQPMATQISRLRFFISLIVDEKFDKTKANMGILALPNLETKFVAANTLIGLPSDLEKVRNSYFRANSSKKKTELQNKDNDIRLRIKQEAISVGATFESAAMLADWSPYNKDVSSPWFDSKWMFNTEKFDIVIANPPYLKERDNKAQFEQVNISSFGKKYHQGKMDFWYYFLHKAIDISKTNGVISFITSRYWLNSAGAKKIIKRVKDELSFVDFVDIGKLKVFDNVAGYHMVAIYSKNKKIDNFYYHKIENNVIFVGAKDDNINKITKILSNQNIYSNNEIILKTDNNGNFRNSVLLGTIFDVSQGVVEAIDKISKKQKAITSRSDIELGQGVFVLTNTELNYLNLTDDEKTIIKKYIDTGDLKRYYINKDNLKNLIYSDKENKQLICSNKKYINIKRHLDLFNEFITSSNAPYGLHRARNIKYFKNPKIIFKGMFSTNEFVYDESGLYGGMSCLFIIDKDSSYQLKYLLAILNSKCALNWFWNNGKKRGGGIDIGVDKLRTFPVPKCNNQHSIIRIVDRILELTQSDDYLENQEKQNKVKVYEYDIDIIVYKLYDLTYSEVLTIDKDFTLSENEYNNFQIQEV